MRISKEANADTPPGARTRASLLYGAVGCGKFRTSHGFGRAVYAVEFPIRIDLRLSQICDNLQVGLGETGMKLAEKPNIDLISGMIRNQRTWR